MASKVVFSLVIVISSGSFVATADIRGAGLTMMVAVMKRKCRLALETIARCYSLRLLTHDAIDAGVALDAIQRRIERGDVVTAEEITDAGRRVERLGNA